MKEFRAQTGGRYTYVDDIENLQNLALAFGSIFSDCDNFIISGCEVQGNSISPGYVYLGGKIRECSGKSNITKWPQIIYNTDIEENVSYASGGAKVGRMNYSCSVNDSVPAGSTQVIRVPQTGGLRIREALFGKYSLLLQTTASSQDVVGIVNFKNAVTIDNAATFKSGIQIDGGQQTARVYYDDDHSLVVQNRIQNGDIVKLKIDDDGAVRVSRNDSEFCSLLDGNLSLTGYVSAPSATLGSVTIRENRINESSNELESTLYVNYGMPGAKRETVFGNGDSAELMRLSESGLDVKTRLSAYNDIRFVGGSTIASKYNQALYWVDSQHERVGEIGITKIGSMEFNLTSYVSDISIKGQRSVDIGPVIKENGVSLVDKYMTIKRHEASLSEALSDYVLKTDAVKYATKDGGLSQFEGRYSKTNLRSHIGAIGTADVEGVYLRIDSLLGGMATTETKKRTACNNIGAAYGADVQPLLKDTGWIQIEKTNTGWTEGNLYVRQIGNIVCIQGQTNTRHQSVLFTLPDTIGAPAYNVAFRSPTTSWGGAIEGGSREFRVLYCDKHDKVITFSMTYMV